MFFNSPIDQRITPIAQTDNKLGEKVFLFLNTGRVKTAALQIIRSVIGFMISLVQLDRYEQAKLEQIHKYRAF